MPSTVVRRIATNVAVFVSSNNVRRSVGGAQCSYETTDGSTSQLQVTIQAGDVYTFTPPVLPTSVVFVSVTGPIIADIQSQAVTVGSEVLAAQSFSVQIAAQAVLDFPINQIVFRNPTTSAVNLTLIEG